MKTAILVTGLKTEIVRRTDSARYYDHPPIKPFFATDGQLFESTAMTITERVVPITQFCYGNGNPDLYVAYSHEVEELLAIPFRTILKEKDDAQKEAQRLRNLSAWNHIKIAYRLCIQRILNARH